MNYMRENTEDVYGIKKYQNELLKIMIDIDSFCSKCKIDYCLMAGSALGAERHQGFIPWDDDIDIYMTEDNYSKFKKKFLKSAIRSKYYLQEWGKSNIRDKEYITMAKLRLNGSSVNEKAFQNWKIHQGIFVDIFILHKTSNNVLKQKTQYLWAETLVLKGLQIRNYYANNIKKRLLLKICKFAPKKLILRLGLKSIYKYENGESEFYHGFIDTRTFSRAVFKKDIFFPTKYVEFEKVKLRVPAKNGEYLKIQFGTDYMLIPPESKRQINKHITGWKLDSKIVYTELSDEKKLI